MQLIISIGLVVRRVGQFMMFVALQKRSDKIYRLKHLVQMTL